VSVRARLAWDGPRWHPGTASTRGRYIWASPQRLRQKCNVLQTLRIAVDSAADPGNFALARGLLDRGA